MRQAARLQRPAIRARRDMMVVRQPHPQPQQRFRLP